MALIRCCNLVETAHEQFALFCFDYDYGSKTLEIEVDTAHEQTARWVPVPSPVYASRAQSHCACGKHTNCTL